MSKRLTTKDFIQNAVNVHGNVYDYSSVEYKTAKTKVKIICSKHGVFEQTPNKHISSKNGCPICSKYSKPTRCTITSTTKQFITKAKDQHGDYYDYSEVNYVKSNKTVIITCKIHGAFNQLPNNHLRGANCRLCSLEKRRSNAKGFIKRANKLHNNIYNYSKIDYVNSTIKVEIVCSKHGTFQQTPNSHLSGSICKHCSNEIRNYNYVKKYNENIILGNELGIFYKLLFTHASGFEFIKVGITSRTIFERYRYGYNDFSYKILEELHTTNLQSALKEKQFIRETKLKKFEFPLGVEFNGKTECYESLNK